MGTFTKLTYHIVFGTKYRRRSIKPIWQDRLYEYTGGIVRSLRGHLIEIGGVEDHVHILAGLPPVRSVSDCVRDIKSGSSKWANELDETKDRFEWQKGYGCFTVSYSHVDVVSEYIRNQEEHHRSKTFGDEYMEFLERHEIEYRPEWVWEDEHHG